MSRTKRYLLLVVPVLLMIGLWHVAQIAAQVAPGDLFTPVRTLGQSRPSGLHYDPNFDRFAWVDPQGQLVIVNAATLEPLHVLYPNGAYNAFNFSRDGRTLAVAFGTRIDIWDTGSGTRVATFAPTGAIRVQGPLQFTLNGELLAFDTIVPAPQELRRSENDTVILPWVWDIAAARDQRNSVLVNRVIAYPFYNVRVSMVAGDNGILVSGLDNRIEVYDADTPSMALIADLPANRLETDPISAWRSATDPYLYVSLDQSGTMAQINTSSNAVNIIQLGYDLNLKLLDSLQNFSLSRVHQSIGGASNQNNPLAQLLLGGDYVTRNGYKPTALDLLDVLIPVTDNPSRDAASDTNLLIYNYNDETSTGYIDLAHPNSIGQIAFTPKTNQLALRQMGNGQIELYDVATGALERIITPSEPDPVGFQTLAYTGDGATLLSDFERFNPATGERLGWATQYTQPFSTYYFTDDRHLLTLGGTALRSNATTPLTWRMWDVDSGVLLRADTIPLGDQGVIDTSDNNLRYLTQTTAPDGSLDLTLIDGRADETQTIHIGIPSGESVQTIIPNAGWTRFLIVYNATDQSDNYAFYPVAVYDQTGKQLYFDAGNNLPTEPFGYGWRDDRTITIKSYGDGNGSLPVPPIMGLKYAPSGLPQCVVDALPNTWQSLIPTWEWVVYNHSRDGVNDIAQQLCTALTGAGATNVSAAEGTPSFAANPTEVVGLLTPSPTSIYLSARTPAPIAVPGVPTCITNRFQRDAVAYAEVWRQMIVGVTDPAKLAELQTMICQGLLSNFGGLQPTPTTDPNSLAVVTATPLPDAPQTTGGDQSSYDVMTIDIETGARTLATGVVDPPVTPPVDTIKLLNNFFHDQYNVFPTDPVISPDGQYMAAQNDQGYVTIYRLARPVSALVQDEQNAIATRAVGNPRSLGLAPTSTPQPQALSNALPTLTPTITLTPLPFTEANANLTQWSDSEAICPAPKLYTLPDLPANFSPQGTLLVSPFNTSVNGNLIWTLNPRSGA
ncbi:MAG: WD40 repeat domain-containing protein, partial [Chloroflexota bacterium]